MKFLNSFTVARALLISINISLIRLRYRLAEKTIEAPLRIKR